MFSTKKSFYEHALRFTCVGKCFESRKAGTGPLALTCLTERPGEGGRARAAEAVHLINALSCIQTGLRLTLINVCRIDKSQLIREDNFICCRFLTGSKTLRWIRNSELPV